MISYCTSVLSVCTLLPLAPRISNAVKLVTRPSAVTFETQMSISVNVFTTVAIIIAFSSAIRLVMKKYAIGNVIFLLIPFIIFTIASVAIGSGSVSDSFVLQLINTCSIHCSNWLCSTVFLINLNCYFFKYI